MQFVRDTYTAEEQWERLRPEKDALRDLTLTRYKQVKLPPSASFRRVREEIEGLGKEAADALREEAFKRFGALGDNETVRPFRFDALPSTLPSVFADVPTGRDVAQSLPPLAEPGLDEQWFILRHRPDAIELRRRLFEERMVEDPATARIITERIARDTEYAIRVDRERLTVFVAGPNDVVAWRLIQAITAWAVSK